MRKLQHQREMKIRLSTRRTWSRPRESLQILLKIISSPMCHLLKTPKEVFDALTKLFEGKSINRKMILRNRLKNVKIQNSETMQSYFTRVAQIKEQLEAVEVKVEEGEIVMTTLNGLPRSWDSFIQGLCAKKKLITFSRLWEECTQEEAWLITRGEDRSN